MPQKKHHNRHDDDEKLSYCRRLLHQCRKDLRKTAKICKNFECQKATRRKDNKQKVKDEKNLKEWRNLSLDDVLQECFRRLGVLDLLELERDCQEGENLTKKNTKKTIDGTNESVNNSQLIERVLQHKRMRDAMEKWSEQVTVYRKWCNRNKEMGSDGADDEDNSHRRSKHQRRKRKRAPDRRAKDKVSTVEQEEDAIATSRSLFSTLGEEDTNGATTRAKKNRAGQKARRAKAQAIEARKAGRAVDQSANWRTKDSSKHRPRLNLSREDKHLKEPPQQQDELHPSWEAHKKQKPTIAAFQGRKITFG